MANINGKSRSIGNSKSISCQSKLCACTLMATAVIDEATLVAKDLSPVSTSTAAPDGADIRSGSKGHSVG